MLEYFVDKIYLTDDRLVIASWYSEDRAKVAWDMLYGTGGNPFLKGDAVKFDGVPLSPPDGHYTNTCFFKGGVAVRVWL